MFEEVGEHTYHSDDLMSLIAMGAWGEGIEHREQDKAHNEDAEQFQIVITYKTPTIHVLKILFLILHDQSETTEKEENWYSIMTEIGHKMHG